MSEQLVVLTKIITSQGEYFDEEWEVIYEIILPLKEFKMETELIINLQKLFTEIKILYVQGKYKGSKTELIKSYLVFKEIIMDFSFDSLYLNLIAEEEYFPEALEEFLEFEKLVGFHVSEETANKRFSSVLNCFADLYEHIAERTKKDRTEEIFINIIGELKDKKVKISSNNWIRIFEMLELIGCNTNIDLSFIKIIKHLQTEMSTPNNKIFMVLLNLLKDNYLKFPPYRFCYIMKTLMTLIKTRETNVEQKKQILKLFTNIVYTQNLYLSISGCSLPSCLNTIDDATCSPKAILNICLDILNEESNELYVNALEVIISLYSNMYELEYIDMNKVLIERETYFMSQLKTDWNKLDVSITLLDTIMKITQFQQIIALRMNPLEESSEGVEEIFHNYLKIFNELFTILKDCILDFMILLKPKGDSMY